MGGYVRVSHPNFPAQYDQTTRISRNLSASIHRQMRHFSNVDSGRGPFCIGYIRGHGFILSKDSGLVFHASGDDSCVDAFLLFILLRLYEEHDTSAMSRFWKVASAGEQFDTWGCRWRENITASEWKQMLEIKCIKRYWKFGD
jgi:hypothetical protein